MRQSCPSWGIPAWVFTPGPFGIVHIAQAWKKPCLGWEVARFCKVTKGEWLSDTLNKIDRRRRSGQQSARVSTVLEDLIVRTSLDSQISLHFTTCNKKAVEAVRSLSSLGLDDTQTGIWFDHHPLTSLPLLSVFFMELMRPLSVNRGWASLCAWEFDPQGGSKSEVWGLLVLHENFNQGHQFSASS